MFLKIKKEIIPIILLLSFVLLFHYRLVLGQIYTSQDIGRSDITHLNYPFKFLLGQSIQSFGLPLWTNLIYSGFPILAEGETGSFYLPNLLLFFFLPPDQAFIQSYLLTFFLAAVGVYLYSKIIKLDTLSAIFAAVTFTFSMYLIAHIIHLNLIQTISLVPWLFLLVEILIAAKKKVLPLVGFSLLLSQQLFAGFVQNAVYAIAGIFFYIILRILTGKVALSTLGYLILGTFLGILL